MKGDWVPFHKRLAKGPKKSIPRGIRFVLLELSLEARATHGVIDLPLEWDTVEAVQDLLGGDRREVRKALQIFSLRDSTGVGTIEIIKDATRHRIVVTKWEEWAGPKSSTDRVRAHRENKKLEDNETLHAVSKETEETPYITGQDITGQDNPQPPAGDAESGTFIRGVRPEVRQVFDHWLDVLSPLKFKRAPELTAERRKIIETRLSEFTAAELCRAIDGVRRSPHHCGQNDSGEVYVDFSSIFRNRSKVEGHMARADATARSRASPEVGVARQTSLVQAEEYRRLANK